MRARWPGLFAALFLVLANLAAPAFAQGVPPGTASPPESPAGRAAPPATANDVSASAAVTADAASPVPASVDRSWTGSWSSSYGALTLRQRGDQVEGEYPGGNLRGTVAEGGRLSFRYTEPSARGEGWFELSDDGRRFTGQWRADGAGRWLPWLGTREAPPGFAGRWNTTYGTMRLHTDGDQVSGVYAFGGRSTIEGSLTNRRRLVFTYAEPDARGEGWFELSEDGQRFEGRWREEGSSTWSSWTGERLVPRPGVVWLVILEANWERSLVEPPYDFGSMLRQYFTMAAARHVQVRHRFFHDEADFRRLAAEVADLAEPVVLLVSSHGTPEGIVSRGGIIGPEAIAESLSDATNVMLLHLSGCAMMAGDVPSRIHALLPRHVRFPISGYRRTVGWDASALGDFTFLSILLIHRRSPADAVRETRLVSPYAGDTHVPGTPFMPLELAICEPPVER